MEADTGTKGLKFQNDLQNLAKRPFMDYNWSILCNHQNIAQVLMSSPEERKSRMKIP